VNGFAKWGSDSGQFYIEQSGVVADALQEALVQDYDGTIRIAPAIPPGWDFDGSVWVRGRTRVDVQVRDGIPETVVIEAGTASSIDVRNPWPGSAVRVTTRVDGHNNIARQSGGLLTLHAGKGVVYLLEAEGSAAPRFAPVSGTPANSAKTLGKVSIGLSPFAR
jgi:hypothetical protein